MKNYKGFEKRPYCNAHCPQAKATTVADTPEIRRLAENTRIQSQAKYHEDFEKSKGKGFTAIADDPETLRLKNTSKIISNVAYHGELERKKQMEERRVLNEVEEEHVSHLSNNNNSKHQNRMQIAAKDLDLISQQQRSINHVNVQHQQQPRLNQLPKQHSQPSLTQTNQAVMPNVLVRQTHGNPDGQVLNHQQQQAKAIQQQGYHINAVAANHRHQQQHVLARQQHNLMQAQQQRHSFDSANLPIDNRQTQQGKLAINHEMLQQQGQHMMKQQAMGSHQLSQQQKLQYMAMNDAIGHQPTMSHIMSAPQLINPAQQQQHPQQTGIKNSQRINSNTPLLVGNGPQAHHMHHHNSVSALAHQPQPQTTSVLQMNGALPKQQQQHMIATTQQHHLVHPSQMPMVNMHHPIQHMRPVSYRPPPALQQMQQTPRRVFRAMYDYVANDVDEVSFFENDILVDCVNVDGNWLIGKVARSGQTGMLPANYVAEFSSH